MSSIPATNTGLSDLLQSLNNSGATALASTLSDPAIESALDKAPPGDLVQLSDQALQLQVVGALFGTPTTDASNDTGSLLSFLDPTAAATEASNPTSLFGPSTSGTSTSNTSANTNALLAFLDPALAATNGTSSTSALSTDSALQSLDNATLSSLFNLQG